MITPVQDQIFADLNAIAALSFSVLDSVAERRFSLHEKMVGEDIDLVTLTQLAYSLYIPVYEFFESVDSLIDLIRNNKGRYGDDAIRHEYNLSLIHI